MTTPSHGHEAALKPLSEAERVAMREAAEALSAAQSLMLAKGWWQNEAGYLTDAALWITKAQAALNPQETGNG